MTSLLALGAAGFYGAADFLGGMVARRASTLAAVVATQGAGLLLLLLGTPLMLGADVQPSDVAYGALAGCTGSIGVALLYRGLAIGPMSVVAPITAVCAVVVPLMVGTAQGERMSMLAAAGVALAVTAVVLLGQTDPPPEPTSTRTRRTTETIGKAVRIALASGIAIGFFFVALGRTKSGAGMWPLAVSRSVSVTLFLVAALLTRKPWRVPAVALPAAVGCGALDMVANGLYLIAVRQGQLGLVATLASLYPASTVILARLVLGERLGRAQLMGVATAVAAIVLIVGNS